jgi:xanthine dehydrogenase YagR molybdenum-binding subunit
MNRFDYARPATLAEAVAAGAMPGASYLAAGTNLMDLMKGGVMRPGRIVDITRLPGLDRIEPLGDGGVRIGALVRNADLAHDAEFARRFPAVAEALLSGASAQLRNAATVGGNLLQRTRCAYFYDTASACNKRTPGAGCDAVGGENRLHAILGWSEHCIATHPSDFCVPLAALDAIVEIEGPDGKRDIPVEHFHRLPGITPEHETELKSGELITAVRLPAAAASFAANARYLKIRERTSYAFAVVSAAAALRMEGGVIAEARIALGGVALKPWRAREAETILAGAAPETATFRRAAEAALAEAKPSGDNAFKIELARRIVASALTLAAAGTPARPHGCPPSRPRPSPEPQPMPEITLTQAPAHIRMGSSIGQPLTRREGVLKTTGAARYAADHHPAGMVHAALATSSIARGRVTALDIAAAKAHPGVIEVMTPANAPKLALDPDAKLHPFMFRLDLLQNDTVRYVHQPIAVVIADTLEAATEGAALLAPRYETEPARTSLDAGDAFAPQVVGAGSSAEDRHGDIEAGLAAAQVRVEAVYETPAQYHNAMEPHAIVASWDGDKLVLDTPSQGMAMAQGRIAGLFGIAPDAIHIRSPFLGGGFGSKGLISGPQILGIMAARLVGRPVKLVLRREEMYGPVGHRAPTRQTLRMGTDGDGQLTALSHHARTATSTFDDFIEPAANASHPLYASPAIVTSHEAVRLDTGTPLFMRAPGEAPGSAALESAIDEMALACGMDPLAFRLKNYAEVEPISGKPFSSKALRQCYEQGAERFGWDKRPQAPRQMRDEAGMLVGWGMGTAVFPALMFQAHARAMLRRDGSGVVEIGAHDMGQGAWTALAQIAADALGLDLDRIEFRSGTSDLPDAGIAGGSAHTATAGAAIHGAGEDVIGKLADLATGDRRSPLFGAGNAGVIARGGRLHRRDDESKSECYADILARAGHDEIEGRGTGAADPAAQANYAMHAHGAVFAEVKVDPDFGQVRVTRLVGAFAAGTVINPRMVRSQYYGGMIWGISFALHEHAVTDKRTGRVMNANLGEYHVPVNADVVDIEAILVEERDVHVNALGIKGVGEIGITGTAGAIANAVWHATGIRVRSFPIKLDDLIGG